jgi:hypothetical protein
MMKVIRIESNFIYFLLGFIKEVNKIMK